VEISDVGEDSVRLLYVAWVDLISEHQEAVNNELIIGGDEIQAEADEICFRCIAGTDANGDARI
jgi:hypothetical protein